MNFVAVESIPERRGSYRAANKSRKHIFEEFMSMNVKFARFEFSKFDYISARSAYDCLHPAIKKLGIPILIHERNGEIYFERRDI